jgi:hypothetical protein
LVPGTREKATSASARSSSALRARPGSVAGGEDPAAGEPVGALEAGDIIALPAVEGNGNLCHGGAHRVGVDPEFGVLCFRQP